MRLEKLTIDEALRKIQELSEENAELRRQNLVLSGSLESKQFYEVYPANIHLDRLVNVAQAALVEKEIRKLDDEEIKDAVIAIIKSDNISLALQSFMYGKYIYARLHQPLIPNVATLDAFEETEEETPQALVRCKAMIGMEMGELSFTLSLKRDGITLKCGHCNSDRFIQPKRKEDLRYYYFVCKECLASYTVSPFYQKSLVLTLKN